MASAGPYASLHLAPDRQPRLHPTTRFLQAGCPSCRPTNSVKALKAEIIIIIITRNNDIVVEWHVTCEFPYSIREFANKVIREFHYILSPFVVRWAYRWALQKRMNRSWCCLGEDSCRPKKSCVRWRCSLALTGEHDWTTRARRRCGRMSDYFDHLLYLCQQCAV